MACHSQLKYDLRFYVLLFPSATRTFLATSGTPLNDASAKRIHILLKHPLRKSPATFSAITCAWELLDCIEPRDVDSRCTGGGGLRIYPRDRVHADRHRLLKLTRVDAA